MSKLTLINKLLMFIFVFSALTLTAQTVKADDFDTDSGYSVSQTDDETMESDEGETMPDDGGTAVEDEEIIEE